MNGRNPRIKHSLQTPNHLQNHSTQKVPNYWRETLLKKKKKGDPHQSRGEKAVSEPRPAVWGRTQGHPTSPPPIKWSVGADWPASAHGADSTASLGRGEQHAKEGSDTEDPYIGPLSSQGAREMITGVRILQTGVLVLTDFLLWPWIAHRNAELCLLI